MNLSSVFNAFEHAELEHINQPSPGFAGLFYFSFNDPDPLRFRNTYPTHETILEYFEQLSDSSSPVY